MKYLLFIIAFGGFIFSSSAQTKEKATKKTQQVKPNSNAANKKAKPAAKPTSSPSNPKSTAIRKRPGKVKVAPKKKEE